MSSSIVYNPFTQNFDFVGSGGGGGDVTSITATAPLTANGVSGTPETGDVILAILEQATVYTNITNAMSPYTVSATDYYLSVDCSAGTVTLNFPNAPTSLREWIVKDRTGNANTNNITLTTPGAAKTFDAGVTYVLDDMYESVQLLANPSGNYEIF